MKELICLLLQVHAAFASGAAMIVVYSFRLDPRRIHIVLLGCGHTIMSLLTVSRIITEWESQPVWRILALCVAYAMTDIGLLLILGGKRVRRSNESK